MIIAADFKKWLDVFNVAQGGGGGGGGNFFTVTAATFSNNPVVYNNGTSGVGATLTSSNPGIYVVDGLDVEVGLLYLFKNQTSAFQNGIYVCTVRGSGGIGGDHAVFTRVSNYNQPSEINPGDIVGVISGDTQSGTTWTQTAVVTTVGTSDILFSEFVGGVTSLMALIGAINFVSADNTLNFVPNAGAKTIDMQVRLPGAPYNPAIVITSGGTFGELKKASYVATRPGAGGFLICSVEFSFTSDNSGAFIPFTVEPPLPTSFDDVDQAWFLGGRVQNAVDAPGQIGQGVILNEVSQVSGSLVAAKIETAAVNTEYIATFSFMCQIQA